MWNSWFRRGAGMSLLSCGLAWARALLLNNRVFWLVTIQGGVTKASTGVAETRDCSVSVSFLEYGVLSGPGSRWRCPGCCCALTYCAVAGGAFVVAGRGSKEDLWPMCYLALYLFARVRAHAYDIIAIATVVGDVSCDRSIRRLLRNSRVGVYLMYFCVSWYVFDWTMLTIVVQERARR